MTAWLRFGTKVQVTRNAQRNLLEQIRTLLAQDVDRVSKARAITDAIRREGAYRWAGLYDVDIQEGVVSNIAWSGASAPEYPTFPLTKGLTSRAIAEKKTINVGDVANDPDYLTALITTRSEIIVPVLDSVGNRVLGTIDVESERPHAFDGVAQASLRSVP
jgi:putative methionine-R-sulfoxide reductase with GAF domain